MLWTFYEKSIKVECCGLLQKEDKAGVLAMERN